MLKSCTFRLLFGAWATALSHELNILVDPVWAGAGLLLSTDLIPSFWKGREHLDAKFLVHPLFYWHKKSSVGSAGDKFFSVVQQGPPPLSVGSCWTGELTQHKISPQVFLLEASKSHLTGYTGNHSALFHVPQEKEHLQPQSSVGTPLLPAHSSRIFCPGRGKGWASSPLPLPQANWHPTTGNKTSLKVSISPITLWKLENPAAFC